MPKKTAGNTEWGFKECTSANTEDVGAVSSCGGTGVMGTEVPVHNAAKDTLSITMTEQRARDAIGVVQKLCDDGSQLNICYRWVIYCLAAHKSARRFIEGVNSGLKGYKEYHSSVSKQMRYIREVRLAAVGLFGAKEKEITRVLKNVHSAYNELLKYYQEEYVRERFLFFHQAVSTRGAALSIMDCDRFNREAAWNGDNDIAVIMKEFSDKGHGTSLGKFLMRGCDGMMKYVIPGKYLKYNSGISKMHSDAYVCGDVPCSAHIELGNTEIVVLGKLFGKILGAEKSGRVFVRSIERGGILSTSGSVKISGDNFGRVYCERTMARGLSGVMVRIGGYNYGQINCRYVQLEIGYQKRVATRVLHGFNKAYNIVARGVADADYERLICVSDSIVTLPLGMISQSRIEGSNIELMLEGDNNAVVKNVRLLLNNSEVYCPVAAVVQDSEIVLEGNSFARMESVKLKKSSVELRNSTFEFLKAEDSKVELELSDDDVRCVVDSERSVIGTLKISACKITRSRLSARGGEVNVVHMKDSRVYVNDAVLCSKKVVGCSVVMENTSANGVERFEGGRVCFSGCVAQASGSWSDRLGSDTNINMVKTEEGSPVQPVYTQVLVVDESCTDHQASGACATDDTERGELPDADMSKNPAADSSLFNEGGVMKVQLDTAAFMSEGVGDGPSDDLLELSDAEKGRSCSNSNGVYVHGSDLSSGLVFEHSVDMQVHIGQRGFGAGHMVGGTHSTHNTGSMGMVCGNELPSTCMGGATSVPDLLSTHCHQGSVKLSSRSSMSVSVPILVGSPLGSEGSSNGAVEEIEELAACHQQDAEEKEVAPEKQQSNALFSSIRGFFSRLRDWLFRRKRTECGSGSCDLSAVSEVDVAMPLSYDCLSQSQEGSLSSGRGSGALFTASGYVQKRNDSFAGIKDDVFLTSSAKVSSSELSAEKIEDSGSSENFVSRILIRCISICRRIEKSLNRGITSVFDVDKLQVDGCDDVDGKGSCSTIHWSLSDEKLFAGPDPSSSSDILGVTMRDPRVFYTLGACDGTEALHFGRNDVPDSILIDPSLCEIHPQPTVFSKKNIDTRHEDTSIDLATSLKSRLKAPKRRSGDCEERRQKNRRKGLSLSYLTDPTLYIDVGTKRKTTLSCGALMEDSAVKGKVDITGSVFSVRRCNDTLRQKEEARLMRLSERARVSIEGEEFTGLAGGLPRDKSERDIS